MSTNPTIVFDTDCVLCSGMVVLVLKHERDQLLHFVGAWSPAGLAAAARFGFSMDDLDQTFLVISNGIALTRSDAAMEVLRHLRAPLSWLVPLRLFPGAGEMASTG